MMNGPKETTPRHNGLGPLTRLKIQIAAKIPHGAQVVDIEKLTKCSRNRKSLTQHPNRYLLPVANRLLGKLSFS